MWCTLLWLQAAAAAMCQLPGSCGTSRMLQLGAACTTDPVQGSTTWELLSRSTIKKDTELLENPVYTIVFLKGKVFLLTLFLRLAVSALCFKHQPSFVEGSTPPWIWERCLVRTPFFHPSNIIAGLLSSAWWIFAHLILWYFSVRAWLDLLGFAWFWFMCVEFANCIFPYKIYIVWEGLIFQFMLWYRKGISVPFRCLIVFRGFSCK